MGLRKIIFILLIFISFDSQAQDAAFTQFYHSPLYLNPAFAGSGKSYTRLSGLVKTQWFNLYKPYIYATAAMDFSFYDESLRNICTLGFIANHTDKGYFSNNNVAAILGRNFGTSDQTCGNWFLSIALQAGYNFSSVNTNKLVFADQLDASGITGLPSQVDLPITGNKSYPDFSSGFLLTYHSTMIGFAVNHIAEPNISFYGNPDNGVLPRKYTFHLSEVIEQENVKLKPTLIYEAQSISKSFTLGSLIQYHDVPIELGLWYRNNLSLSYNNSFAVSFSWKWGDNRNAATPEYPWSAGISYDAEITKPNTAVTYGSSEFGISKDMGNNGDIICPTATSGQCFYKFPWEFY